MEIIEDLFIEIEPENINEPEIHLDPVSHAIATENYFNGNGPNNWSLSGLNLIDTVDIVTTKPVSKASKTNNTPLILMGLISAFLIILFISIKLRK